MGTLDARRHGCAVRAESSVDAAAITPLPVPVCGRWPRRVGHRWQFRARLVVLIGQVGAGHRRQLGLDLKGGAVAHGPLYARLGPAPAPERERSTGGWGQLERCGLLGHRGHGTFLKSHWL